MQRSDSDKSLINRLVEVNQLIVARRGNEAIEKAEQMMRESPDDPIGYFMLGLYAFSQNDFGDAIELFNSAHERDPDCREYADCLAILYTVTGKLSDGLYFAKLSTALDSDPYIRPFVPKQMSNYFEALDRITPSPHYVNAMMLFNARRLDGAIERCELELKQNDRHDMCYLLLGKCQLLRGQYAKAAAALHAAIHLDPDNAETVSVLGTTLGHLGRFDEAMVCHKLALSRAPDSVALATAASFDAEFLPDTMDPTRAELREGLAARIANQPTVDLAIDRNRGAAGPIRIGYLSNALYDTEQAPFLQALLKNHDRSRYEIICYQQSIADDSVTVGLQNVVSSWREVFDIEDAVMDMIVNGDRVDILVDLCGNTWDNRAGLIAKHPAPMQIAFLEPPFGIRAPGIDIVLSDAVTGDSDLRAVGEGQGTVQINTGLLALEPFTLMPPVNPLPAGAEGRLTFGGHCDLARLTPETAALWSRALAASGRSKLLLGNVDEIPGEIKNHIVDLFGHFGMSDRIMFWETPAEDRQKVEFFQQIDVLLDTYPISGRLEICKALWMGVPVLSLMGPRRVSQVGASILHAAARDEWICRSAEAFVDGAAAFANDLEGLAETRAALRKDIETTDLFSPKRWVEALENIYAAAVELSRRKDDVNLKLEAAKIAADTAPPALAAVGAPPARPAKGKKTAGRKAGGKKSAARPARRAKGKKRAR